MSRKRLCVGFIGDVRDGVKVKKSVTQNTVSTPIVERRDLLEDALPEEFQPQFLNYMLIGDLVAIMILQSKSLINKTKASRLILHQNFCHSAWSVGDILNELKSKKNVYPVAKTVILSAGYNDYCSFRENSSRSIGALMLAEGIDKIIQKLRKRGCEDIILTSVPPAAAKDSSVIHWKYLQTLNTEIVRLSEKYPFVGHCNIFKLFSVPKNYFSKDKNYVTFEEINYKIDLELYNQDKRDRMSFNETGKSVLGKHIARSIEYRNNYLRQRQMDKVICSLEISDSEDVEEVPLKKDPTPEPVTIDLLDDEDETNVKTEHVDRKNIKMAEKDEEIIKIKDEDKKNIKVDEDQRNVKSEDALDEEVRKNIKPDEDDDVGHVFNCTCKKCQDENQELLALV